MKLIPLLRQLLEVGLLLGGLVVVLRFLTGLFSRRQPVYRLTVARQIRLLFWPLLTIAVCAPLLGSAAFASESAGYQLVLLGGLALLTVLFAGPALVLHAQYYVRNQHTTLHFEPKQNRLQVYEQGQLVPFARQDVQRVDWVVCRSKRFFWSPYEYIRLHLADGRVLTITSLLTNLLPLAEFLRNTHRQQYRRWWCPL